jgi:predicted TIM-barrel enzyme
VTLLLFLTTYDHASQVMARQLKVIVHTHRPRINVGAIVLETSKYSILAPVFTQSLELDYPVAMADDATLQGLGPFGAIRRVPTLIVLDGRGRRVRSEEGYVTPRQIERMLNLATGPADQP